MKLQRSKGTQDLAPAEMKRFRLVEGVFRDCCLRWGYQEVRTPTIEYLHLFTSTGTLTPGRLRRVYSFLDWDGWSGERVVLRPDGTIPIARLYIDTMAEKKPARLFYVTNIFVFEETGRESRERWQCGAELIGAGSAVADAEMIILAMEVLKGLGLDGIEIRLSHAGLIRVILAKFGLDPGEQVRVFDQILDGDIAALTGAGAVNPELGRVLASLLNLKGKSSGFLKNVKALFNSDLPELEPVLDDFIATVDLLQALGYKYQIDITAGKGFEYYTGVIFHLFAGNQPIGGGGRYDGLIPLMGGGDVPAAGFALYCDRLMKLIKVKDIEEAGGQKILINAGTDTVLLKEAFRLVGRLHEAGYQAELHLGGQETVNLRWTIDVQDKNFRLTDRVKKEKFEVQTADEVLKLLGGK